MKNKIKILLLVTIIIVLGILIFIKFIDNDIEIEHFDNYKPSLNDIFVSTVGDEQTEEQKEKEVQKYEKVFDYFRI